MRMPDFSSIARSPARSEVKRLSQRDLLPLVTKFRLSEYYDPKNNNIDFKDNNGNSVFKIELSNGTVTFGTNVKFDAAVTKGITPSSFVQELIITLIDAGTGGGTLSSYYTDTTTYQNLNISEFLIDPDDYPGSAFYLEAVMRAGATGDPARTVYADLYDVAAAATVTGSEISTTTQSTTDPGGIPRVRGTTNIRTVLTSGDREYIVRYKSGNAGLFVDLYAVRLIIVF